MRNICRHALITLKKEAPGPLFLDYLSAAILPFRDKDAQSDELQNKIQKNYPNAYIVVGVCQEDNKKRKLDFVS